MGTLARTWLFSFTFLFFAVEWISCLGRSRARMTTTERKGGPSYIRRRRRSRRRRERKLKSRATNTEGFARRVIFWTTSPRHASSISEWIWRRVLRADILPARSLHASTHLSGKRNGFTIRYNGLKRAVPEIMRACLRTTRGFRAQQEPCIGRARQTRGTHRTEAWALYGGVQAMNIRVELLAERRSRGKEDVVKKRTRKQHLRELC